MRLAPLRSGTVIRALLAWVLLAAPASASPLAAQAPADAPVAVTGYALGSLTTATIARNAAALTTVTVAGVPINADGDAVRRPDASMKRVRDAAHDHGLRAELLLSNYSDRLEDFDTDAVDRLLTHDDSIDAVGRQVARYARAGGWDGVNVDLEAMRRRDGAGLVRLLQVIRDHLADGMSLTIDVSARPSADSYRAGGYRLAEIGAAVDVVQLMTYDEHGPGWSGPGPVGGLPWQRRGLEAALEQVPAERLDVGVAGYGYTWPRQGTGRTISPRQARALVQRDGATARWRREEGEWSARLSNGTRLWWSDARSFDLRRSLAEDLGLHGVALWRLGSADRLS